MYFTTALSAFRVHHTCSSENGIAWVSHQVQVQVLQLRAPWMGAHAQPALTAPQQQGVSGLGPQCLLHLGKAATGAVRTEWQRWVPGVVGGPSGDCS